MGFTPDKVVPWGRSYNEYVREKREGYILNNKYFFICIILLLNFLCCTNSAFI